MSESTPTGKIEFGLVVRQLFDVIGRNIGPFALMSVALVGLSSAIGAVFQATPGMQFWSGLATLVTLIGGFTLQGALIHAVVKDLNGRPASLGESFGVGLNNLLPLLAIGALSWVCITFCTILLIVPGVMLAIAWAVAAPAYLSERRVGIMDSFGRSAALTRGNRWRILGLFLAYLAFWGVIEVIILSIGGGLAAFNTSASMPLRLLLAVVSVVSSVIGSTGTAVLYANLRKAKEGVGPEGLAAVFD